MFWLRLDFHGVCHPRWVMRILEAQHPCRIQHRTCCKNGMSAKNVFAKGCSDKME